MTREEAIRYGNEWLKDEYLDAKDGAFIKMAIEALEQQPILDKIKGYIAHIRNTGMGKKKSLEFIEKFIEGLKVESEDKG